MTDKPLLLITRAPPGSCPDCERYNFQVSTQYKRFLRRDGRLEVLDLMKIDKDTIYAVNDESLPIHPELYSWVAWWPSFIIVNADTWKNHNAKLEGYIYGGVINPTTGVPMEVAGKYNLDNEESLIKWTVTTLNLILSGRPKRRNRLKYRSGGRAEVIAADYRYSETKMTPNR